MNQTAEGLASRPSRPDLSKRCARGETRRPPSRSWPPRPAHRALATGAAAATADAPTRPGGRSPVETAAYLHVRAVTPNQQTGEATA